MGRETDLIVRLLDQTFEILLKGRKKEAILLVPGGMLNNLREWQHVQLTYITVSYFQSPC